MPTTEGSAGTCLLVLLQLCAVGAGFCHGVGGLIGNNGNSTDRLYCSRNKTIARPHDDGRLQTRAATKGRTGTCSHNRTGCAVCSEPWLVCATEARGSERLSAEGRHHLRADEVLQFAPMATVWGLRLAGVKGKNEPKERLGIIALSYASLGLITFGMKAAVNEERPDGRDCRSFPSGHTARAFMGAEMLYQEYKDVSPWIGYSGYAMAALTGYLRVYNNRHYLNDVVAGAASEFCVPNWDIGCNRNCLRRKRRLSNFNIKKFESLLRFIRKTSTCSVGTPCKGKNS